jgi:esterase/lipase superfamily enzyme
MELLLRFATNRNPIGKPITGFGSRFNPVHPHELRFGEVRVNVARLTKDADDNAQLIQRAINAGNSRVTVYEENLAADPPLLGSRKLFDSIKQDMNEGVPTVLFIHGYNVSFNAAVASALALTRRLADQNMVANVVLFSWPSDGSMAPFVAYKSDRDDAAASGLAFSRAFQKLRDYLVSLHRDDYCGSPIHLVCHSMGNFVLENTLWHLRKNVPGRLPRVFREIVLASADVDADCFEQEAKLARLPELGTRISVYYNRGDEALHVSDLTKGNPDRLGTAGPKHPLDVPNGVVNVDCSQVVEGLVEHSYFLHEASSDLAATLNGVREDKIRGRNYVPSANAYRLTIGAR